MNFLKKLKEIKKAFEDKENLKEENINKIISTYKMHKKKKEISENFKKIKILQRCIKRFIWKKKILKIVKIQSIIRKK